MKKPYVISEELDVITPEMRNREAIDDFRIGLEEDLRAMGKQTIWVAGSTIRSGMQRLIGQAGIPVVSLDNRYVRHADCYIGISRAATACLTDSGYGPRAGCAALSEQLNKIPDIGSEVMLADDVVFSGEMISWLVSEIAQRGVTVSSMACGVGIREGMEKLYSEGIDVAAVVSFDEVDDEICERDLTMTAGSGRRVPSLNANALYFDPDYGRPEQWASIPAPYVRDFCIRSIRRTMALLPPDMPMNQIGRFVGYGSNGTVQSQMQRRLEELI